MMTVTVRLRSVLARALGVFALAGCAGFAAPALAQTPAQAPAPSTQMAFIEGDAGVYTVADKEGKPTNIAYRFYVQNGKWVAEERAGDGGWTAFKCEKNCEIKTLPEIEISRLFGKLLDEVNPGCVGNGNFAVCRYILRKNPAALRYMMMVQTDKGISLVHLLFTAGI